MIKSHSKNIISLDQFLTAGSVKNCGCYDIECPYEEQYILRMAIQIKNDIMRLPSELLWILPILSRSIQEQRKIGVYQPYIYVTVRHGVVKSKTDDEWHVDGFSMKIQQRPEQNYIWSNRDGTEVVDDLSVGFPEGFDPLRHNVNHYLQNFVDDFHISKCDDKTLYQMDPYILHRRPINSAGMKRTFVRISFVPIEINDVHNTQNPIMPLIYSGDGVIFRNNLSTWEGI